MPFIEMLSNTSFDKETADRLTHRFGKLIELIPGKSEQWLMVNIVDKAKLSLAGDSDTPAALISLEAFGRELSPECYDKLTQELCRSCSEICGISPERIYVKYLSTTHWGWNGKNFQLRG